MQTYTLDDINAAWKAYEDMTVMQVLSEGRWRIVTNYKPGQNISGTSARTINVSKIMDFPDFLKDIWKPTA